ncbi:MAG: hypothetical protein HWQ23_08605 [Nostoc sp. JL33]|uniref:hypothetical protein n=1 Tax=Nostoc sp. JL33 TaxID=2815396 RepID=UPI0025E51145|nr:hypothetical protein [Nostoc sp. JL33]MBN3870338.1 hypothetical protein [Nostoc sp. JL33]
MVDQGEDNFLEKLMENSDSLDAEGKAKLIKHLLGEPGLQLEFRLKASDRKITPREL